MLVFHISSKWCFFTGVRVTVSHNRSPWVFKYPRQFWSYCEVILPPSSSWNPFSCFLGTVIRAPTMIAITVIMFHIAQSAGDVEYTDCTFVEGVRLPPLTSILDMTLKNRMLRFQWCWSFGECGVPLHCYSSQVQSGPEW